MSTFGEYTTVLKPRKAHKCVWCHTPIIEKHLHYVGMYDGDWQDWRIHLDCKPKMEASDTYDEFNAICPGPHGRGMKCEC